MAHAGAAAGALPAINWIDRRLPAPDLFPVDLQLLGHQHRHGSHHALPHLRLGDGDRDAVIAIDQEPRIGTPTRLGYPVGPGSRQDERQHQSAAGSR